MVSSAREFHLLVPDAAAKRILVGEAATPALPVVSATVPTGQTSVSVAIEAVGEQFGLRRPLLELFFSYGHEDDAPSIPALVVLEGLDGPPPDGLRWHVLAEGDPDAAPELAPRMAELLGEWRSGAPPAPLRPRWSLPGWHDRAGGWIREQLTAIGRPPIGPPEQIKHWGISALMRIPTAPGPAWFKAVFPLFAHEPAVTTLLGGVAPGVVPRVLAADPTEGWLLLDDFGAVTVEASPEGRDDAAAINELVALQRRFVGRLELLREAGCPERPLSRLAADLDAALRHPVSLQYVSPEPARRTALVAWVAGAAARIEELGFPETLVHGDFHPANVALVDGRPLIFDWSDTPIGHPLLDAITWMAWFEKEDPMRGDRAWHAFLDAWSNICAPADVEAARSTLLGLAAAFHTVSYAAIVAAMEPLRRPELADGLTLFFRRLDEAAGADVPAS